jgi:plasmid replication initiation protein
MGLRGPWANPWVNQRQIIDDPQSTSITPEAIAIYRKMRRHERQQDGPGDEEWWRMNARLADCFGLYGGMVVYEDPAWEYPRCDQSDVDRFFALERAAKKQKPRKAYKWER